MQFGIMGLTGFHGVDRFSARRLCFMKSDQRNYLSYAVKEDFPWTIGATGNIFFQFRGICGEWRRMRSKAWQELASTA